MIHSFTWIEIQFNSVSTKVILSFYYIIILKDSNVRIIQLDFAEVFSPCCFNWSALKYWHRESLLYIAFFVLMKSQKLNLNSNNRRIEINSLGFFVH